MSAARLLSLSERFRKAAPYYPLTIPGTMLFGLATALIGNAFADGNRYAFLLSVLILVILIVLAVLSRLQAAKLAVAQIDWDTSAPLFARRKEENHRVSIKGFKSLPFFRVHFILHGNLRAGRDAAFRYHREIPSDGATIVTGTRFPVSGVFHARGALAVKDVFGLTRGALAPRFDRSIIVRPAPLSDRQQPRVEAQRGDENKSRMKSSDVERYFMREYIPGDRHRDINWKASSRFSELFTRISPVTQEKTKIVTVHFRPYTSMATDSLRSVFFLDQCKSALLFFLRAIKQDHPDYQFAVYVGSDVRELSTGEDIEAFGAEIATAHYRNPRGEEITAPDDLHPGDVFIFTTAYDSGLSGFLTGVLPGARIRVYRVVIPRGTGKNGEAKRLILLSGTEAPLFCGRWVLRRDPLALNPGVGQAEGVVVEDEPMEVRLV
ncbi:MAG: DUF58 domain-containing protein [Spirochaetales bacterium]|nr:DUF58 domain-containing protein [Spirochaetales bacterium]